MLGELGITRCTWRSKHQRDESTPVIPFAKANEKWVLYPHNDALVVTILVINLTTRRILIDNGSSADILLWEVFTRMGIDAAQLHSAPMSLKGFSGSMVHPLGTITLTVLTSSTPCTTSIIVNFLVVRTLSSYNSIIGRPTLNSLQAVMSTYQLKMKFLTPHGVVEIRGEQVLARECYVQELKQKDGRVTPDGTSRKE
ncbi:uncharacterized protein LOC121258653 [Juglans microcarpa x Juglans regia]|uniref:uncharacterized protein LOC121258653 n=1 Tax=Juglans microcarpa x Juglans regia TaxID=2249226 RepID=UPI001B7DA359|nr:uncharacterized protein LOC121258653 [Juglans microcarpa x Juglans regia]